jgi:hypothetical protein
MLPTKWDRSIRRGDTTPVSRRSRSSNSGVTAETSIRAPATNATMAKI